MPTEHKLREGEGLSAIAQKYGLRPETIWNDQVNAESRKRRKDMETLYPGDSIVIPDKVAKKESASTGCQHRYEAGRTTTLTTMNVFAEKNCRQCSRSRSGGLTLGSQETSFASNWPQTLIFLTDGAGTKFSVLKYKERSSPIEKVSAQRKAIPWFPRESAQ